MRFVKKEIDRYVQQELSNTRDYNCDAAKDYLEYTYEHSCAYCEGRPESTSSSQIEHFYEKTPYPQFRIDLHNLHYSCQRCNSLKENNKKIRPILSPNYRLKCEANGQNVNCNKTCQVKCKVKKCKTSCKKRCPTVWSYCRTVHWESISEGDIQECLRYSGHLLFAKDKDKPIKDRLAQNTIDTFDLNNENNSGRSARGALVDDRLRVYCTFFKHIETVFNCIVKIRNAPNDANVSFFKEIIKSEIDSIMQDLKGEYRMPYTQMLIDNFGETLLKILKIIDCTY